MYSNVEWHKQKHSPNINHVLFAGGSVLDVRENAEPTREENTEKRGVNCATTEGATQPLLSFP